MNSLKSFIPVRDPSSSLFRSPARFVHLFVLSILLASGFLATRHKSDIIRWYKGNDTSSSRPSPFVGAQDKGTLSPIPHDQRSSWPSPEFWAKLSRDPRSPNRCSSSGCLPEAGKNQSQFADPFNPAITSACPFYFRWIYEDLAPWMKDGISRELLDSAKPLASFRVVIKSGRLYVDPYTFCFQTRSVFTIWGLMQLVKFYPDLVPDVDFLFGCGDRPQVTRRNYNGRVPPPVFRYCSTVDDFDIPFPDWSFWGWPEVDLKPWDGELSGILNGEKEILWERRAPTAFWKGNTHTGGAIREGLRRCNKEHGAEIIHQNWGAQTNANFKNSRLAQQCRNRYKIYVEGWGWSVSLKYILACDSPVLLINPIYFDFFSRGLVPKEHFWPVRRNKLCDSIKFGVDWGNKHEIEAEAMGRAGSQFVTEEVSMKRVYDYMLHSLREYAKLLRFEPTPGKMTELCSEAFLCQAPPRESTLYEESMVQSPSDTRPCFLPPRDEDLIKTTLQQNSKVKRQVEDDENEQWGST